MPTTNPIPSTDPSDLLFNAGKLDEVVNGAANSFTDRLGVARRTVAGMNADFDAQLADAESDLNVYRADAAASAAEALGYLQTIRATSYGAYAEDPTTDPLGNLPTVGDEYFNTTSNLLKRWNGTTWQASDINTANLAAPSGSSFVGYDGGTVQDVLDGAVSKADYVELRAYTGRANRIYITGLLVTAKPAGIAGVFQYDPTDTTSADNGGTIIVGADGRRWKRQYDNGYGVVDWFDTKGGSIDDTLAIQKALDVGFSTLAFTKPKYTVSAVEGALHCLLLSKNTNLVGLGGSRRVNIDGALTGTTTPSVLRIAITDAGSFSDVRNWRMDGLSFYPYGGGKHGVHFDGTVVGSKRILTSLVNNCTMAGRTSTSGYAIYIDGDLAHCEFSCNTLENGVYAKCYDANVFRKNTTFGSTCAFTFDCAIGVRNNTVEGNTIVNRDGIVRIINGDNIRILNNQMEQMLGYTPAANQNPVSAMVWLEGVDRPIYNTVIRDNNFGGGTNVNHLIYVDNAQRTVIGENNMIAVNTAEVYFTAKSKYNIFKPTQRTGSQVSNPRTKSLFKAKIIDLGVGNMGVYKEGSKLSPQNGWVGADFYKDEYGVFRFIGEFSAGTTTAGTLIGTLPDGNRPYFQPDAVRRNLLTYTEQLDNAAWYKNGVAVTADSAIAPDGKQTADLVYAGTANAIHSISSSQFSAAASSQNSISMYFERADAGSSSVVRVELNDNSGSKWIRTLLDLSAGTTSSSTYNTTYFSTASTTVEDAGGGKWRLIVTFTTTASGASASYSISFTPNNVASTLTAYTGDSAIHRVLAWGFQAEVGASTTYQRVADAATFETVFASKNIAAMTSSGPGYVSISRQGLVKVGSLPSNIGVVVDPFQAADVE